MNKIVHGVAMARPRLTRTATVLAVVTMTASGCGGSTPEESAAEVRTTVTSEAATTTTLAFTTEMGVASAPPGAGTVAMLDVEYEPTAVEVTVGAVVLFLDNQDPPPPPGFCLEPNCRDHDMQVTTSTGLPLATSDRLAPGESAVFTIEALPAGTYPFHCTVGTHAAHGMRGTLEVTD
jgi:uncharacterized cupredoxin-like copper-binding protein